MSASDQLLVLIDPVARRHDGESVRIAKDVLSAGAALKVCLPDSPEEFARALVRRGSRRPVVVGDDRALLRTVGLLHRERELAAGALSLVPIGGVVTLARSLGVPTGAVAAARAVLEGVEQRLDLLVDDSDGVVLGDLRIPSLTTPASGTGPAHAWLRTCQSLVRSLGPRNGRVAQATAPGAGTGAGAGGGWGAGAGSGASRLRVEADGVTLVDLDQPVDGISVVPATDGYAVVEVRPSDAAPMRARARTLTVSGPDFRYRADAMTGGPVRTRTWTVRERAWGLTLPG
ncbi:diacylglycerol kinase [Streptomyces sp. NPDC091292]|uniref:diacylglycerol kinase n=1 Tax=Streptomyces sp. NPDC091292 TaxID=3365991 RepID=UPI00382082D3